jgi:putative hemolysin
MIAHLIAIGLLLICSAFFSGSETAFTSLSLVQIKELTDKRGKRGKLVKKLTDRPDLLLATILIGNNLVNIAASVLATKFTLDLFGNKAVSITTGVMTLLVLIFAEVTPKRIAIAYNDFISLHAARAINLLSIIFRPFILFISGLSSLITRMLRIKKRQHISMQAILHMVNMAESTGLVDTHKGRMVRNVFRFNDITIQSVMTHRTEVFSLDMNLTIGESINEITTSGYSRVPVYGTDPERIEGIVLVKDVTKYLAEGKTDYRLRDLMIEPIYVPHSKRVNEMFIQFKREKLNIAVVLDEYGGLAGIVTQEDIIEEILGDLYDENEIKENRKIEILDDGRYTIAADISLHQLNESLGIELPKRKYTKTLGGYIVEMMGYIPQPEETLHLPVGEFTIERVANNRITGVIFTPRREEETEEEAK